MIQVPPSIGARLEDFLLQGEIILGRLRGDYLLTAGFVFYNRQKQDIHVESDRGADHILLLLLAELLRSSGDDAWREALSLADRTYPYPISVQRLTPLDRMVLGSTVLASFQRGMVHVACRLTGVPHGKRVPGSYYREGTGKTLADALTAAYGAAFVHEPWLRKNIYS